MVKRQWTAVDRSPHYTAEVKNERCYINLMVEKEKTSLLA